MCHLLSPKVPILLRHSVLSQLEVTHLKHILASVYATNTGKKVSHVLNLLFTGVALFGSSIFALDRSGQYFCAF